MSEEAQESHSKQADEPEEAGQEQPQADPPGDQDSASAKGDPEAVAADGEGDGDGEAAGAPEEETEAAAAAAEAAAGGGDAGAAAGEEGSGAVSAAGAAAEGENGGDDGGGGDGGEGGPADNKGEDEADEEDEDEEDGGEEDAAENLQEMISTTRDVVSFWKRTAGHRPDSAEIAQKIEGFEDDFKYIEQEDEEEQEEEEEEEEEDPGPNYRELIEEQESIQAELKLANSILQKKVLMIFEKQHRQKIAEEDQKHANKLEAGYQQRFESSAKRWLEMLEEEERVRQHYQAIIFDQQSRLEERSRKSEEIHAAFRGFKLEVARSAENSKTGRPIPENRINELDEMDTQREEEVEKLRLRNINLRAELRKLEGKIQQKEQLAEGLHLIDFEQLKIENQSLNEKIEERNEELLKLRKKTTSTVQVLTHIREKLQFIEKENKVLHERLSALDKELVEKRDKLQKVKTDRDRLRMEATRIKENSSYISKDILIEDVVIQRDRKEDLLQKLAEVKAMHASLTERVSTTTHKIIEMTEMLNTPGSGIYSR